MTTLVLGSTGQLASHLKQVLSDADFWGRERLDLANERDVAREILKSSPAAIVIAAAYTAVDRAESESVLAWQVNAGAPAAVATAAAEMDIPLIYVSTDYVFDGQGAKPYRETEPVNPLNVYGKTKLAGEIAVATIAPKHWILRTSWVFSEFGSNFVKTILNLAREMPKLTIVDDQVSTPTYAGDLSNVIAQLLTHERNNKLPWGIYHATGGPAVSWYQFAKAVVDSATDLGLVPRSPNLEPIPSAAYPTAAQRPAYSVLATSDSLLEACSARLHWTSGLQSALSKLAIDRNQELSSA